MEAILELECRVEPKVLVFFSAVRLYLRVEVTFSCPPRCMFHTRQSATSMLKYSKLYPN